MHSQLFKMICQMGIFVICAQTMIHFRPDKSYEKYLKLLVSIMILIQLFLPVGKFFLGDYQGNIMEQVGRFQLELEESVRKAREAQMTLEKLREEAYTKGLSEGGVDWSEANPEETRTEEGIESVKVEAIEIGGE
ncbi:MAG: stage III sporulation protein AF [Roseburia sp.]|nr:stage III sporulation protein AF [Roseburia sp.]